MSCTTLSFQADSNDAIARDICAGSTFAVAAATRDAGDRWVTRRGIPGSLAQPVAPDVALDALANCLSHDMRTPLRAMEGIGELLAEQVCRQDRECVAAFESIRAASHRLTGMFADLVEFARLADHKPLSSRVDLSALARGVATSLSLCTLGRAVKWTIAPGLRTVGDAHLLDRLLTHLFGNALKFTLGVPCAFIEFGSTDTADGNVEFFVRDNGIGFDPGCAKRMFHILQRLPGAESFEGNGCGLAIARRIVALHGGNLRATGAPGGGATFIFSLPGTRVAVGGTGSASPKGLVTSRGKLDRVERGATHCAAEASVVAHTSRVTPVLALRLSRELARFTPGGLTMFAAGLFLICISAALR